MLLDPAVCVGTELDACCGLVTGESWHTSIKLRRCRVARQGLWKEKVYPGARARARAKLQVRVWN